MVRHEAAEALGGIATPDVLPYLKEWMKRPDAPRVVRESCQVAIDMWEVRRPRRDFCGMCWTLILKHFIVRELERVPVCQWSRQRCF